jgi:hypothetical protein
MNDAGLPFLRPMTVAELLDAAFRLFRNNFLLLVAIVAVVQVPLTVLDAGLSLPVNQSLEEAQRDQQSAFDPETYDPDNPPQIISDSMWRFWALTGLNIGISGLLALIGTSLMTGALAWAVAQRHLGRPVTVGRAYRAVFRRWKSLLGATLLILGVYLLLIIIGIVPCVGWIFFLPMILFCYACLRFAPQAVMLEERRAGESLRRSWYLVKPLFWRVFGMLFLLWLLGIIITAGPSLLVNYGLVALQPSYLVQLLISTVLSTLLGLLYTPIRLTGETLIYYDLRVRQEGLDLELEAEALGLSAAEDVLGPATPFADDATDVAPVGAVPVAAGSLPPVTPPGESFLIGRDWKNLAILLGVGLGLVLLCIVAYVALVGALVALAGPMMDNTFEQMILTMTPGP